MFALRRTRHAANQVRKHTRRDLHALAVHQAKPRHLQAAGLVLCFCALFFGQGPLAVEPVVWIGGLALLAGAVAVLWAAPPGGPALAYLGCLFGLALWCGISMLWSVSPDRSWLFTNRTLAYAGFALLGVLRGPGLDRAAAAASVLAAAVLG